MMSPVPRYVWDSVLYIRRRYIDRYRSVTADDDAEIRRTLAEAIEKADGKWLSAEAEIFKIVRKMSHEDIDKYGLAELRVDLDKRVLVKAVTSDPSDYKVVSIIPYSANIEQLAKDNAKVKDFYETFIIASKNSIEFCSYYRQYTKIYREAQSDEI